MKPQKSFIRRLFGWLVPEDTGREGLGYWLFKLPASHPFTRAGILHDWEFAQSHGGTPNKPKTQVDWDFFWRMTLIAKAEEDLEQRMRLVWDIIWLWSLARPGGEFMWDGDPVIIKKEE